MLYIVLNVFCKKLAESLVLPAVLAAWIPCLILFPLGLLLTYKAMNDSKLQISEKYLAVVGKFLRSLGSGA
jgi:lipopolysaccharide export system permease protein